jgi:hypothetical protein
LILAVLGKERKMSRADSIPVIAVERIRLAVLNYFSIRTQRKAAEKIRLI